MCVGFASRRTRRSRQDALDRDASLRARARAAQLAVLRRPADAHGRPRRRRQSAARRGAEGGAVHHRHRRTTSQRAEGVGKGKHVFQHGKFCVADRRLCSVGSWNAWARSAFHEMELNMFFDAPDLAERLAQKWARAAAGARGWLKQTPRR